MNTQVRVLGKKTFHSGSFMPGSIICPKIDDQALETGPDLGENLQEPIGVSSHPFDNSMKAIERIDPTKKIETLVVLAFCVDVRFRSLLAPDSPEPRVKGETGFIFKKHHSFTVAFSGEEEFFLTPLEIRLRPRRFPAHIGKSVCAECNPASVLFAGRVAHGFLSNVISSDTQRPQRHPSDSWTTRIPEETSKGLHRAPPEPFHRFATVCPAVDDPQSRRGPLDWPFVSTLQLPICSIQRVQQPGWISSLPASVRMRRFGYQSMPPGLHPPNSVKRLGSTLDEITSTASLSPSSLQLVWET